MQRPLFARCQRYGRDAGNAFPGIFAKGRQARWARPKRWTPTALMPKTAVDRLAQRAGRNVNLAWPPEVVTGQRTVPFCAGLAIFAAVN